MDDNRVKEIKKEDKKQFRKFIIMMIVCGFIGAVFGATSVYLKEILGESIPNLLISILTAITPYASLLFSIVLIIYYKIVYSKSRKEYDLWKLKNEDDDKIEKIEEKLSYLLLFTAINMIIGFFFIGVGGMILPFDHVDIQVTIIKIICFLGGFTICITSTILIQKKIVNFEKEINPLLQGSVYDFKFGEKFLESCDEASRLGIYISSYKAYKAVNTTCVLLWLFCILGYDLWDFGIMPMTIVIIIWLVQTISYCMESIKYSKFK